jgi:hypothetical protein
MSHNKLLKYAAKNAAGQLLAGFANNTRNCPLAGRYMPIIQLTPKPNKNIKRKNYSWLFFVPQTL